MFDKIFSLFKRREQPLFTFDDITLIPQYSEVLSRTDPYIGGWVGGMWLDRPIISANMDCVTNANMAIAMASNLCGYYLHRFYDIKDEILELDKIEKTWAIHRGPTIEQKSTIPINISVGVNIEKEHERLTKLGIHRIQSICIDIAHGHHAHTSKMISFLRNDMGFNKQIMAGSVATYEGTRFLIDNGVDIIRAGVSSGMSCSTRIITGCGVPQASCIIECARAIKDSKKQIGLVADGGIKKPADFVKAIALGADAVMMGGVLASTDESAAKIKGKKHKIYRGQSSKEFQEDTGKYRPEVTPEGEQFLISRTGPVKNTIDYYIGGLKSAMSYAGASNLDEFRRNVVIKHITTAGYIEGTVHGKSNS